MSAKKNSIMMKAFEETFGVEKTVEVISTSNLNPNDLGVLLDYQIKLDKTHELKLDKSVIVAGLRNLLLNSLPKEQ